MIDQPTIIAQTINFILLIALLYRLLYKPVHDFMEQRTAAIELRIKSAEENQAAAAELRQKLESDVASSKQQAREFLDEAVKRADVLQAELVKEAREEAAAIIRRAQEATVLEKEKAWAELKKQAADLSILLASKVIDENLDQARHQALIEQTITELDLLEQAGQPGPGGLQ